MKIAILSPCLTGNVNGCMWPMYFDHMEIVPVAHADLVIVPISDLHGFQFNRDLEQLRKPWVLFDWLEWGPFWPSHLPRFIFASGLTPQPVPQADALRTTDWQAFERWASSNKPRLIFQRELIRAFHPVGSVLPLDFTSMVPIVETVPFEEYIARPLEVFYSWGYSNPIRPAMQGKIFLNACDNHYTVVTHWEHRAQIEGRDKKWAAIHVPHQCRIPMPDVMRWNRQAKISLSLPGHGLKCFRHAEAPNGSLMAHVNDDLAYSYPWDDSNSIVLRPGYEYENLVAATQRLDEDLYDRYVAGMENARRYEAKAYVQHYLMPYLHGALHGNP